MHTIQTEIHVSDEDLFYLVKDSGWSEYVWWREVEIFNNYFVVTHYPKAPQGDYWGDDQCVTTIINTADIAAAINALPAAQMALLAEDMDADVSDEVMQYAAYGEVIWA